jgi:CHAD domain-containing protein
MRARHAQRYDRPAVAGTTSTSEAGTSFVATYHDTSDGRLARAGIRLRRRMENGAGLWEAEIADTTIAAPGGPGELPAELMRRLRALLHGRQLVEVARLRAGDEDVAVLEGQHVVDHFRNVEDALRSSVRARPEDDIPPKTAPALTHVQAYLRRQLAAIERHDPGVRLGSDPEDVHQMRVAVRRARAVLRAGRDLLDPDWTRALRSELQWLGDGLAPVRDSDVLLAHVRVQAAKLDAGDAVTAGTIARQLEAEAHRVRAHMLEVLDSPRYVALLEELDRAAIAPRVRSADVSLDGIAGNQFKALQKTMKALGKNPSNDALHRARIRGKRARYAAELAEPIGGKRARRFIRAAKTFQDVIGAHQDAVVAEEKIRAAARAAGNASAALAAGRLVQLERERRRAARSAFPRAWKKLERRGRKAWG